MSEGEYFNGVELDEGEVSSLAVQKSEVQCQVVLIGLWTHVEPLLHG